MVCHSSHTLQIEQWTSSILIMISTFVHLTQMSPDVTHVTTCQQFMTHKYTFYRHFFFVPLSFEIHHTRTCQSYTRLQSYLNSKSHMTLLWLPIPRYFASNLESMLIRIKLKEFMKSLSLSVFFIRSSHNLWLIRVKAFLQKVLFEIASIGWI